jgi:DeoR family transcriptional regulator, fructose operon transcriptional repressor
LLAEERRLLIVDWTRSEGRIDAAAAAGKLDVAVETVRRDLDVLQRRGVLRRVHGGAISLERFAHEPTIGERYRSNPDAKRRIAEAASNYLPSEGCVIIDGGTTTEYMAPFLRNRPNLTVVTNSLSLARAIADSSTHTQILSGKIRPATLSAVGARTVEDLSQINAVVAFVGTNGISNDLAFTAYDTDEAAVKRMMIKNSIERIVLADHSKFGSVFAATFAQAADFDRLVSDVDASSEFIDKFSAAGAEVVLA